MKFNPKHHNPKISTEIDNYYDENFNGGFYDDYDSCYYDDSWDDDIYVDYESTEDYKWVEYNWLARDSKIICSETKNDKIINIDGHKSYTYEDGDQEFEIYTFGAYKKIVAFFGLILVAMHEMETHSPKLTRLYNTLVERYPEIYIKLLDRIK